MNKRALHHTWTIVRKINPWFLFAATVISGLVCIFALRANNEHMVQLRSAVFQADKNNGNVETALENLRNYVYAHMNTNLASGPNPVYPPIQLTNTYNRLLSAENQRVQALQQTLYPDAQAYCQQQNPTSFSGRTRVPCIEAYVQSHGAAATPIPAGLYEYNFLSPKWSPDLAGWSLVVTVILGFLFVVLFIIRVILKRLSK